MAVKRGKGQFAARLVVLDLTTRTRQHHSTVGTRGAGSAQSEFDVSMTIVIQCCAVRVGAAARGGVSINQFGSVTRLHEVVLVQYVN